MIQSNFKNKAVFLMSSILIILFLLLTHSTSQDNLNTHIKKKIFDECFDYYSFVQKDKGATKDIVTMCKDKTDNFSRELDLNTHFLLQ
jgi:hypothetical protein